MELPLSQLKVEIQLSLVEEARSHLQPVEMFNAIGTLLFGTGTVQLSDAADLTITSANGAVTLVTASVGGTTSEDITINAGTGTLAVGEQ